MKDRPRLFLIDGHALAYRTYFALSRIGDGSRFTTRSGEPTAGVYGFASVLLRLLSEEHPEYLAVSFDTGRTFRDDIYPEYKATRSKMPEDMVPQLERIRELVQAFGIPIFEKEGYEADDVLGSMARRAPRAGAHAIILTGDRDLLQLADENTTIRLAGQRLSEAIDFGPQEVIAKLGIRPAQIVDYKALVGDPSDNIPGVRGIGEKTAIKLLHEFGSLDEIYANLDQIPARFRNKLEQGKEDAYLSRRLAKIVTDLPLEFELEQCRARGYDRDRVVELFRQLEFRSLLERLPPPQGGEGGTQLSLFVSRAPRESPAQGKFQIISDEGALAHLVQRLASAQQVAFDVETTSTVAMHAQPVGIALATTPEEGFYIPVGHHPDLAGSPQLALQQVLERLAPPLQDADLPKVGHNLKYDFIILARHGLRPAPLAFDTMIAEWLCDPGSHNLGLKNLAWVRLGVEMTTIQELIGRGRNQRSMAEVPVQEVAPYAAADARICLQLKPLLEAELQEKSLLSLFYEMEMPLVPVLADMEMTGILMDTDFLQQFSAELAQRLSEIEAQIYQQVGHPFNINSTRQLSQVLFEELGLQPPDRTRKTASGHYSTAAGVLEQLRDAHPVVSLILEQREIAKLKSTYADALLEQVNPATGRIHTSYNQTGSVTGRIASSDPNLQNIPIRTDIGRRIRRAFRAADGYLLLGVDYSQIELRIVAHMADDQAMIQAFLEDQDIHAATAAAVFNLSPDEITPEMRRRAKAVNFGLIYGMSPFGLTRTTDLTLAEAEQFVQTYFQRFPGVRRYLETTRRLAAEQGYVETLFGRRRYFPQLQPGARVSEQAKARAEREAINAPIQGTAADIIKIAMIRLAAALRQQGLGARLLLQVHDELVLECPQEELKPTARLVRQVMQHAAQLKVPLKTDAKAGPNWAEMEPLADD